MGLKYFVCRNITTFLVCGVFVCLCIFTILSLWILTPELNQDNSKNDRGINLTPVTNMSIKNKTDHYIFETFLMVVVMSTPKHGQFRQVVRETWARTKTETVRVYFVVGTKSIDPQTIQKIQDEQGLNQDLIVLDYFEDSYAGLTKKLLMTLVWAHKHINFKYLLKVDEDSFVQLNSLVQELMDKPMDRLYWGFFNGKAQVHTTGKWGERDFNLCDHYLPYALGGGYVISQDLVKYLANNRQFLKLYTSEDVSLGAWLGPLDIHKLHDPRFDTEYKSRGCFNSYLVTHKKTLQDMRNLQNSLDSTNKLCTKEYRVRMSYNYNWESLPTNCCNRTDRSIP